ncbi:hypothetical protein BKA83DRAFT_4125195 [Pisolithus microcarpus]|nr:hypothetical protein BKA83DRAFT_4125195 [Pisolithus microcarpus]
MLILLSSVANFPQWRFLSYFKNVINVTFSDRNKMWDVAKVIFYALLNVFTKTATPEGCCLLSILASYLQLDIMINMELLEFDNALKDYVECMLTITTTGSKCKVKMLQAQRVDPTQDAMKNVNKWIIFPASFEIWEYRYLKVNYESLADWKPWYNCALIQLTESETVFVCLISIFTCDIPDFLTLHTPIYFFVWKLGNNYST